MTKLAAPLAKRTILRPVLGGIAFGLVGVALPLTLFTGTDQLTTVIRDGTALGAGLLIAVVFAKILVFALCEATGFIGGPFLVMLFIGGTAGTAAHVLIPGLPEGLAFAAMFAALPGSLVAAPFSLILLARPHDPDRHAADRAGSGRGAHGVPRRLWIRRAHGPGAQARAVDDVRSWEPPTAIRSPVTSPRARQGDARPTRRRRCASAASSRSSSWPRSSAWSPRRRRSVSSSSSTSSSPGSTTTFPTRSGSRPGPTGGRCRCSRSRGCSPRSRSSSSPGPAAISRPTG